MGLVARVTSNGRASNCTKHRLTLPVLVNESLIIVRVTILPGVHALLILHVIVYDEVLCIFPYSKTLVVT